jgi:CheY-like chemotaxis protein
MAQILIVDDQQHVRFLVKRVLEAQQHTVTEASDGIEALKLLDNMQPSSFDLILLDLLMPKLDGYEFLRRLRLRDVQPPVVIVTALWKPVPGVSDYPISGRLSKPFTRQKLIDVVQAILHAQAG